MKLRSESLVIHSMDRRDMDAINFMASSLKFDKWICVNAQHRTEKKG